MSISKLTSILARLDPDSSRIRKMMEEYVEERLEPDGDRFTAVGVYIRKTENESPFKGITH